MDYRTSLKHSGAHFPMPHFIAQKHYEKACTNPNDREKNLKGAIKKKVHIKGNDLPRVLEGEVRESFSPEVKPELHSKGWRQEK